MKIHRILFSAICLGFSIFNYIHGDSLSGDVWCAAIIILSNMD